MKVRDQMIYSIVIADPTGAYTAERELADMGRDRTIKQISEGQFEGIAQVLECNPIEGICRDVTEDFAWDVCDTWAMSDEPLSDWRREFLEIHLGIEVANRFPLEAAE